MRGQEDTREKGESIMKNCAELEDGVYYDPRDYAGLVKRVVILLIDMAVLLLTWVGVWCLWIVACPELENPPEIYLWVMGAFTYGYLSVLKPSRFRTVGYRVAGVKIVDLQGNKPSFFKMLLRFCLLVAGPLELFLDLAWLTGGETKQTFRDKYVGTYVVGLGAMPIGRGPQAITEMNVLGWHLMFREVKKLP